MSSQNIGETQRLIKFVEKNPFSEEDKKTWLDELHNNGINGEMLEEVHKKFLELPDDQVGGDWSRARENMEILNIRKQWRLSLASRNFHHSR